LGLKLHSYKNDVQTQTSLIERSEINKVMHSNSLTALVPTVYNSNV